MRDSLRILLAEDSDEDADLLIRAMRRANINSRLFRVKDGREAIDYMEGKDRFGDRLKYPFPQVLISDLKMPRIDGLELLAWLKDHPTCSVIPAILLSGSDLWQDVNSAYELGANTFFEKPASFHDLVQLVNTLHSYWMRSELPAEEKC